MMANVRGSVRATHAPLPGSLVTLTDPRSVAVGYGPDCADNYGLPWGALQCEAA